MTNGIWPEYVSATEVASLLRLTPKELRSILDDGKIETDKEDDREYSLHKWNKSHDPHEHFTYFTQKLLQTTQISVESLRRYASRHNISLSIDNMGCIIRKEFYFTGVGVDGLRENSLYEDKIASLESQIDKLKAENARLYKEKDRDGPKTAEATIAGLKGDIEKLKQDYTGAVRLASEIVKRGPKGDSLPWTQQEVQDLAKELEVSLKGERMKLFKEGMPDHLVKKTPGARRIS